MSEADIHCRREGEREMPETQPHLWEADERPYGCMVGKCYSDECEDVFDSWKEFLASGRYGGSDPDEALVFRWDWTSRMDRCPECVLGGGGCDRCGGARWVTTGEPGEYLYVFGVMQEKALLFSSQITVRPEDEAAVREWLAARGQALAAMWEPLRVGGDSAPC